VKPKPIFSFMTCALGLILAGCGGGAPPPAVALVNESESPPSSGSSDESAGDPAVVAACQRGLIRAGLHLFVRSDEPLTPDFIYGLESTPVDQRMALVVDSTVVAIARVNADGTMVRDPDLDIGLEPEKVAKITVVKGSATRPFGFDGAGVTCLMSTGGAKVTIRR